MREILLMLVELIILNKVLSTEKKNKKCGIIYFNEKAMNVKLKKSKKRQFLKASIFIVSAVLFFVAVYSIYPVFATIAPGSLEPGCSPTDPGCNVSAPLVTELSANTNITMATNTLSFNTSTLYIDPNNSRIGINTTSPLASLDVYGNLILSGTDRYLNFGSATSSNGYGLRDNSGILQLKNSDGNWINMVTSTALTVNSVGSTELSTTTVMAGAYGTAAQVLVLTVDEDGRITNLSTSSISIAGTQITSGMVSSTFGGTSQDSSAWTGVAYINGGVWSASSSLSSGLLVSSVMLEGENISLLTNNSGYITSSTADTLINKTWNGVVVGTQYGGTGTSTFTSGGLVFSNGTILTQNSSNLYWDNSNMKFGIGTDSPLAKLHITTTTEQLRLGYDGSHYASFVVDNNGELTILATGVTTTISNLSIGYLNVTSTLSLPSNSISSNEIAATTVVAGEYGTSSQSMILTVDADGRITNLSTSSIAIAGTQIISGVVANTYGGSGQDTSAWSGFLKLTTGTWSTSTISLTADITGVLPVANGGTGATSFTAGSLIFSNGTILAQDNSNFYWDDTNNRLGLGTTTPASALQIVTTTEQLRLGYNAGNYVSFTVSSTGQLDILSTGSAGIVKIGDAGNTSRSLTANDDLFVSGKLEVDGISYFDTTSTFGGNLTTPANALVLMSASSTLRMAYSASAYTEWTIGTDGQLSIASGQPTTTFSNNVVIDNLYSGILTMSQDGGQVDVMDIPVSSVATSGTAEGYNFLVDGLPAMSIYGLSDAAGSITGPFVSIGTVNTSSYKLYVKASASTSAGIGVDGYVRATGYITGTTTLDLAESYPIDCSADGKCPQSFDVVCSMEKEKNFVVEKCLDGYSDNVIGVVSEKPGFGLGDYDPMTYNPNTGITPSNYRMIALSGRVPVNVANANGNIKAGDYLTSSNVPGVAVKAIEPGRVIGVALTSSNSATGTVMVFVNPHWNVGSVSFVSNELPTEYGILDQFTMAIKNSLRKLGLVIEKGIAKVKELRTEKLCVGETCITESELKTMLNNNNTSSVAPVSSPVSVPANSNGGGGGGGSSSTPDPVVIISTSTPILQTPTQDDMTNYSSGGSSGNSGEGGSTVTPATPVTSIINTTPQTSVDSESVSALVTPVSTEPTP
jgi:hypothetical protein